MFQTCKRRLFFHDVARHPENGSDFDRVKICDRVFVGSFVQRFADRGFAEKSEQIIDPSHAHNARYRDLVVFADTDLNARNLDHLRGKRFFKCFVVVLEISGKRSLSRIGIHEIEHTLFQAFFRTFCLDHVSHDRENVVHLQFERVFHGNFISFRLVILHEVAEFDFAERIDHESIERFVFQR